MVIKASFRGVSRRTVCAKPDYIQALSDFGATPQQPVDAFIQASDAVTTHDADAQLARSTPDTNHRAPRHGYLTRFADG
jgi:hypothetical protein